MGTVTVSVMFTDLVGSTALMSKVGEEAAEQLRRDHFALLRTAVDELGGREVKNLGDGLMVAFTAAVDAVAAAVAMQRGFERRNRGAEHPLEIRVGIACGDADEEDGDLFGPPVVQAARLCAVAGGGETLASDVVRLLAGTRGGHAFEPVGELDLKGIDEPVSACRVTWEPEADVDTPLPARLAASVAANFVGRTAEHERAMTAWKEAVTNGERRVVLVSGEPGIGKTTLSARVAGAVRAEGALVVYGRSDEDLGVSYQPWIEALGQLASYADPLIVAEHLSERGPHLARLVPELAGHVAPPASSTEDDVDRFVLFGCVADLLERVTADRPVLMVLDDMHWADRQSVQLLRHVVTCGQPMRLVVLGTFRDSDVGTHDPVAELLAALHREDGVDRIPLVGLSDADLLDLLEQIAGHDMDEAGVALRDAVLAETTGNPFFIGEVLRHLAETGVIYRDASDRWVGDGDIRAVGLPVSVKEVVVRRLATLGPETERVLSIAAVIGRDFDVATLAAITDTDEDTIIDLCDAAVDAAVLRTTDRFDRYTFAHALIEHALYDGLSPARRARTHRVVAEAIEGATLDPSMRAGELAHHWAAAVAPTDADKALHYAQLAGERALAQVAPHDALGWFTRAAELLAQSSVSDEPRRVAILFGLGESQRFCGVAESRETLISAAWAADRIDDVDLLVRAAVANSRGFGSNIGDIDHERVAVLERARQRAPADHPDLGRLLATLGQERDKLMTIVERQDLADQAIAAARSTGSSATVAWVLKLCSQVVEVPATLEMRRAWLDEAAELVADDPASVRFAMGVHSTRANTALQQGDGRAARAFLDEAFDIAPRYPDAGSNWTVAFVTGWLKILDGDLGAAERAAEVALDIGLEAGQPDALGLFGAQVVNIRLHQGRFGEVVPMIEQAIVEFPTITTYQAALALAVAYQGDVARSKDLLAGGLDASFSLPDDGSWLTGMACWAEAAVLTGHAAASGAVRERLAPFADQIISNHVLIMPAVAHYLGCIDHFLGDLDSADQWFRGADRLHRSAESPLLLAHSNASWASLLVDRGRGDDHERARALATDALEAATTGGYGSIEAIARGALDQLT